MIFDWDENKRLTNINKHGIDFEDAKKIFDGITVTIDDPGDYGEERYVTIGMLNERGVAVVHTESNNTVRMISARKATKHEQKFYFQQIGH